MKSAIITNEYEDTHVYTHIHMICRFELEQEHVVFAARDPVIIERSNLVNISKLIVKELIETSLKYGRMLDSDHMPLQHFFIVLEHVLRHGLRPKKVNHVPSSLYKKIWKNNWEIGANCLRFQGLLGPKKELWDILQLVEKYCPEAQDITSSIRDLPTVRYYNSIPLSVFIHFPPPPLENYQFLNPL